jgi:hypothetical protein
VGFVAPGWGPATTFLYRFRNEHEKFLGTDFADLQRELRGREDVIWMTLSSREEQAGRFALALALAQQGWSRPRFGLRGRAARAWFEREFAALDFPGRREMPSLTDASAEALLEGLVQSSRDRTILLIRRNRHGALFAEEGQFVYRKGELTDFLRHGTADRGGP